MLGSRAEPRASIARAVRGLAVAGLLFLLLPLAHWATRPLPPGDVFWQVRTGAIALDTGVMPASDPFSYTVPGAAWNNHEWAFELLVALVQRTLGWGGIRLMVLAIAGGTALALAVRLTRRCSPGFALLLLTLFALLCRYKMMPVPQLASMALFLFGVDRFRGLWLARSVAHLGWLSAFLLLWGNLTAECFMFLPFLLLDQLCLRAQYRSDEAAPLLPLRRHLLGLAAAMVAPMLNPPWSSALEYALTGTAVNRTVNSEFDSILHPASTVTPLAKNVAIALMLIYVPWAVWALWRSSARVHCLRRLGPGLLAVALAAAFERNLWLLLLPAARLLTAAHSAFGSRAEPRASTWPAARVRLGLEASALALSVALFSQFAVTLGWSPMLALRSLASADYRAQHFNLRLFPSHTCLEPLERRQRAANVYTLRLWANYLIWSEPQHKVFVDGRNREYPASVHEAAEKIWHAAPETLGLLEVTRTDFVLIYPGWGSLPAVRHGAFQLWAGDASCALYGRGAPPDRSAR
jgi:hypothetical protein